MLLSTSLISILSSVVAISVSSKRRLPRPRAPFCLCPLTCKQPKPHSEPQLVANEQQIRTAAGSNDLLRAAGAGQGWEGAVQENMEGRSCGKYEEDVVVRTTGLPQTRDRSASASRAPSICGNRNDWNRGDARHRAVMSLREAAFDLLRR